MNFKPFPELQSNRLFLRKIVETDCDTILYLRSDNTINKYIERPENRQTKNITDAIKFIKALHENIETNTSISWGITLKDNPNIIGTICLWNFSENKKTAEVGYDLDPKFQGKGFMSEALKLIIDYGFNQLKLEQIEAFTHMNNEPSKQLLKTNGFLLNENRKDIDNALNIIFELKNASSLT